MTLVSYNEGEDRSFPLFFLDKDTIIKYQREAICLIMNQSLQKQDGSSNTINCASQIQIETWEFLNMPKLTGR